ncbi:helix-turn-helix domain-containing protein [Anaerostipes faecalis]|uniref:helix-turn-helix domain-containing protein n=1 Tax=Anaerostipes faecalis TaxID=2738446 RepID=UPI001C1E078A|nr:helix-turn-helix transcriptional regulator [Anaerostipes faecalis]
MNAVSKANSIVAVRLKKVIKDKGIKQAVIAEKAEMTAQELSDMLNGRRIIKVIDIQKLLEVLGEFNVDANYLFGIEEVGKK